MNKTKDTMYIPYEPGMNNYDICICYGTPNCKKDCLRNRYNIIKEKYFTASDLTGICADYEPDTEENKDSE